MKQGQLSVMLVLGITLLAVVGLVLLLRSGLAPSLAPDDPKNVELYVTQALSTATVHCLNALGLSGGDYRELRPFLATGFGRVAYAAHGENDIQAEMRMQVALERCVEDGVRLCVDDFNALRGLGLEVEPGRPQAGASLNELETGINIVYPVHVQKAGVQRDFDRFATSIPVRLKKLIGISDDLSGSRVLAPLDRSFDLTYLASLDVNASIYQYGQGQVYALSDGASRVGTRPYVLLAAFR